MMKLTINALFVLYMLISLIVSVYWIHPVDETDSIVINAIHIYKSWLFDNDTFIGTIGAVVYIFLTIPSLIIAVIIDTIALTIFVFIKIIEQHTTDK